MSHIDRYGGYQPGNPDCPHCAGAGVNEVVVETGPPVVRLCKCVLHQEIINNVERGMKGLSKARVVKSPSPLLDYAGSNLWITSEADWFLPHLRHVAIRQRPSWDFRVVTDSDLISAWLATAAAKGMEIMDPDAKFSRGATYMTLADIAEPPTLMVLRLGVKSAPNRAMPEVLFEAIAHRNHLGKPTWVWDQPSKPLQDGHLCYSHEVVGELSGWKHLTKKPGARRASGRTTAAGARRPTLSEFAGGGE